MGYNEVGLSNTDHRVNNPVDDERFMNTTREGSQNRQLLNPIGIVLTLILLAGMVLVSLAALFLGRDQTPALGATPVVTFLPAPTITPTKPQPTQIPSPTSTLIIFLPEGLIGVGGYVQVSGTEGAGLRMRSQPSLGGEINFTAMDSEVFLVIGGPVEADGYTWWHLEAPYDQTRNGWSAGEFLTPIEEFDG